MENGQRKVDALELKRLAELYKQSITYFTHDKSEVTSFATEVSHLARKVSELSSDDREELGRFVDFLRARKKKGD
jgi:hypothetical protein